VKLDLHEIISRMRVTCNGEILLLWRDIAHIARYCSYWEILLIWLDDVHIVRGWLELHWLCSCRKPQLPLHRCMIDIIPILCGVKLLKIKKCEKMLFFHKSFYMVGTGFKKSLNWCLYFGPKSVQWKLFWLKQWRHLNICFKTVYMVMLGRVILLIPPELFLLCWLYFYVRYWSFA